MTNPQSRQAKAPRVFISCAHEDRRVAEQIADALSKSGTNVWFDKYEVKVGASLAAAIDAALEASDYLVVLLSPHSIRSQWVSQEVASAYGREIDARAITLVPVLLEDCDIPPVLAAKQYIDLRLNVSDGIATLAARFSAAIQLDFSVLSASEFEDLVGDLLRALSFDVQQVSAGRDGGVDLVVATHHGVDPFGAEYRERFLVECKHYRHGRANLDAVQTLIKAVRQDSESSTGLLITNGQFTSPVREWAAAQVECGNRLRLLSGTELKRLLLKHPEVARKYLAKVP